MSTRMRRPEEVRVEISHGDWLLLKKHLTAGEQRAIFDHMVTYDGTKERWRRMDYGPALIAGYLLDWSITDLDGKVVPVRDQSYETIITALDNALDPDGFTEVLAAVEKHIKAVEEELAAEKNAPAGAIAS